MEEFEKKATPDTELDAEILAPSAPKSAPVSEPASAPVSEPASAPVREGAPRPVRTTAPEKSGKPLVRRAARRVPAAVPKGTPAPAPVSANAGAPTPNVVRAPKGKGHAKKQEKSPVRDRGGVLSSVLKALLYIAFVLIVSGFLAVFGIQVANDVFAFVKDDVNVEVTIPENATLEDISTILYDKGLVENSDWFYYYTTFKYRDRKEDLTFVGGTYELNSSMNYNTFISSLMPKGGREIVSVLIPEGYNVDQIIDLLVSEGIGTREGYVNAIQNYDYNYEFLDKLASIELKAGRKYRLEGYLFPAKYDIYRDSSEIAVIDKMLAAFQANFDSENYDRCQDLGLNMDEVITLASIIQYEARYSSDMYYISGVFHNRLNNASVFPRLDSDATVLYALIDEALPRDELGKESPYEEGIEGEKGKYNHVKDLTKTDLEVDNPYNTYKYNGLTPGAICNPGLEAITAALYPEDKLADRGVKSYYFVAGVDGYSLFAATQPEHSANINKVAADKEAAKTEG